MKNKILLMLLFTTTQVISNSSIYMQPDGRGSFIFSDEPLSNKAEVIENIDSGSSITPAQAMPSAPKFREKSTTPNPSQGNMPYALFMIGSPQNQESIQNQPILKVTTDVQPALQKGDVIQIYLDGQPLGGPRDSTYFEFPIPERGTHQLSAVLIDEQGNILKETGPITIYIHQAHVGSPAVTG